MTEPSSPGVTSTTLIHGTRAASLRGAFTNWGPSQPGPGECVVMVADGRWYSVVCDDPLQEYYVVCEG